MGADFLTLSFSVPAGVAPNWDAATSFIDSLKELNGPFWDLLLDNEFAEYQDAAGKPNLTEIKTDLHSRLYALKEACNAERSSRFVSIQRNDFQTHYIVGGLSWGDNPSEVFTDMSVLFYAGVIPYLTPKPNKLHYLKNITVTASDGFEHNLAVYLHPNSNTVLGLDDSFAEFTHTVPDPYNPGRMLELAD